MASPALFGPAGPGLAPSWALDAALTLAAVLAFGLGYWLGHFLLHRVPALWEIHKVHHSAEVMTPATAARVHPLEDVLLSNFIAVALGVLYGLSSYVLGGGAHELTLFEVNVVFVAFYLTTYHLRNSHLWLRVPRPLAYVLHSPAHHQIHHSADPAHFDRNFGFALSLWDWAFGTLHVPGSRRPAAFGIGAESKDYTSVGRLFLLPFVKIARAWRPRAGAMAEPR